MINKFNANSICEFLNKVDTLFPTPLSKKQDLKFLSEKLFTKGTLCTETDGEKLVSLVGGYTENIIDNKAYISVVATLEDYAGKGIATKLVKEFIDICREKKIKAVHLYTSQTNFPAIRMYEKIGFIEWKIDNEPRKEDLHLIYYTGENKE